MAWPSGKQGSMSGSGPTTREVHATLQQLLTASAASIMRAASTPAALAKQAYASGADAVVTLVERQAGHVEELTAERDELVRDRDRLVEARDRLLVERDRLAEQAAAERRRLVDERAVEREHLAAELRLMTAERDRLAAELRALRGARGELPRTSGELRAWREERGLTQVEVAERLGVGSATVERAEQKPAEAPLGRAVRLALARDAAATRESTRAAAPPRKRSTKRSR